MTKDQVISSLASHPNRAEVARATGIRYMYLSKLVWGHFKNPGTDQIDKLRDYFSQHERVQ